MPERPQDPSKSVLIAGRDAGVLDALSAGLASRGYKTTPAESGVDALDLLRRRRLGVLVVEFSLSDLSPLQLIEAAHRMHPQLIVTALMRPSDQVDRQAVLAAGASDICLSPVTPQELDAVLRRRQHCQAVLSNRLSSVRAEVLQKAIRAIASAVDIKMRFAGQHSARVTESCLAMAAEIGLSLERMDLMELAAQIHDIGMIAVPDDAMAKPQRLDDLDWVDVLKHPALGSAMLAGVPELAEVAAAVRHHHERFDGQGYPDGLFGDAIPLFSRLIAVADAYEAMTSERPHRRARTHGEAITELRRNAGTQFDPALVELLEKVLEIRENRRAA